MLTPWDAGLHWSIRRTVDAAAEALQVSGVRDDHLRGVNGSAEDTYIAGLIVTSRRQAERFLRRALVSQTWVLTMDRFPECTDYVELQRPPLIEVISITYVDQAGVQQTWPADQYQILETGRDQNRRARIGLATDVSWPTTRAQRNAVTVTARHGYATTGSPEVPDVPDDILHGQLLMIGELYKQRSESVHALNQSPALVRARDLWTRYRIY